MTQLEQLKAICEKQKEIIRRRCQHSPSCSINQNWDEARQAMADTPVAYRDAGYYEAMSEIERKSKECTCGLDKLLSELSDLEKIEIEEKKAFIDVAPPKDKVVCGNCKYFDLWGVVAGGCSHPELKGKSDRPAYDSCYRFEVK